ncbi:hypothetical protein D9757_009339 [Collybiopsis confluens]|uniref:Zn(2)-C6 fungal-type domain-containing protein n=1 Tax=Collybiopsis confluens TaxID=2823264 RepID=A0A8H5M0I2_9AGAR|nr:hypothetical protein D9757_009339 [Collybiopsis confluens]
MPPAAEPGPVGKGGQTPKKGGSKAKGSVRAKSGCYTCRIRRKKCDERPDAEGRCETCLRLRLQCLGFGAKRPEWLRGMIKGHSGSGPRAPEQEPPTLHLSAQTFPSPTQSPPSQLLVLSNEAARHEPISAVREEWPFPGPPPPPGYDGSLGPPPPPGHPAGPPILHPGGPAGPSSRNPSPFGHPPPPPQEGFPPAQAPTNHLI